VRLISSKIARTQWEDGIEEELAIFAELERIIPRRAAEIP
jgi:hypothetical protein